MAASPLTPPEGGGDPDAVFDVYEEWAGGPGPELYPAQKDALIELVSGSNVILSHADRVREVDGRDGRAVRRAGGPGRRTYYTAPLKALVSEKFFDLWRPSARRTSA